MNHGLLIKSLREVWPTTTAIAAGLALIEGALAYVVPTMLTKYQEQLLQLKFVREFVSALLGANVGDALGDELMWAFPWTHPVVLAIVWAHAIWYGTRSPSGEIDRGTVEIVLALPVSRTTWLLTDFAIGAASGVALVMFALLGNTIGVALAATGNRPAIGATLAVVSNLAALHVAVLGMTSLVSALCDRRGRAVAAALAIVLVSFFLNFLAQFWEPARTVRHVSVMEYYRPFHIVRDHSWPLSSIGALLVFGVISMATGLWAFRRRDIRVA